MKLNLKLISLILIMFFISIAAVSAVDTTDYDNNITEIETNIDEPAIAEEIVSATDDTGANNPTARPSGFYELQQKIWKAASGDTIELDDDYVYDGERDWISIDRSITLDGKGHTLDGNNNAIFYVTKEAPNVVIKNVTFINGQRSCGGAIIADEGSNYLTIDGCTFKDNEATTSNVGGAIFIKSNYGTITNCYFENNVAPSSGGAIRIEGNSHTISNNVFTANRAVENLGGAINVLGHNNKITNNTFTRNTAGRDGGAIDIEGTSVGSMGTGNVISNNQFISNRAAGSNEGSFGGAISIAGQNCEISNNNFTSNHADRLGGAIRWNGAASNSGTITGNRFEGNDAKSGGAIYDAGSGLTISKNTFYDNKATDGAGGAINVNGNNAVILDNEITKSSTKTSGGAIYLNGNSAKIQDNYITQCSAENDAGALYLKGASATVSGNKFISNDANGLAGAALIKSNNANIKNNEFSGNVAKSSGGAAYIEGAKITLENNVFSKNQAGAQSVGGAVRFYGNDAKITKNSFVGNTANVGFAYYGSGENPTITSNTFSPKNANTERWEKTKVKLTTPTKTFKKTAKTKKVIVTLKSASNKAIANKKITLKVNKKTYTAKTNSKGQATFKVKLTKKGTYKYTAKFAGNTYYYSLSKTGKIKIK